jgi:hypothetical protein
MQREHKGVQGDNSKGQKSKWERAMYICNCIVRAMERLNVDLNDIIYRVYNNLSECYC